MLCGVVSSWNWNRVLWLVGRTHCIWGVLFDVANQPGVLVLWLFIEMNCRSKRVPQHIPRAALLCSAWACSISYCAIYPALLFGLSEKIVLNQACMFVAPGMLLYCFSRHHNSVVPYRLSVCGDNTESAWTKHPPQCGCHGYVFH